MKKTIKWITIALATMMMSIGAVNALKFTIDGDLTDWGITPTEIETGLNCNPNATVCTGDVWKPEYVGMASPRWVVEDDVDPQYAITNPESYDFGPHFAGYGANFWIYKEPKVNGRIQPSPHNGLLYGTWGDDFDVEAIYVDEDADYLYVAAVVSAPPDGYQNLGWPRGAAGDLALDVRTDIPGGFGGYDFGVRLGTWDGDGGAVQFGIYRTDEDRDWHEAVDYDSNSPVVVDTANATLVGNAIGAYINASEKWGIWEYVRNLKDSTYDKKPIYIVELAIPKTKIGLTNGTFIVDRYFKVHLSEVGCGNDAGNVSIPEFVTLIAPIGLIIGVVSAIHYRRGAK
ncbi:hypothetical protein [Geoglobus ahangari]|nr:hypothetical protein [Geoglobus ahangari]